MVRGRCTTSWTSTSKCRVGPPVLLLRSYIEIGTTRQSGRNVFEFFEDVQVALLIRLGDLVERSVEIFILSI